MNAPFSSADDVSNVIIAVRNGRTIALRDVANVTDGFGEPTNYVTSASGAEASQSAVTIAIAKRAGANATSVGHAALTRLEQSRGRLVPDGMRVDVTRDYGETAAEKASELILHLAIATLSVTALVWLFLGWREALVVLVAVPVTLALTLFVYYLMGYTLNRITLFALIFSIGILVDDAIVVVENIARHVRHARSSGHRVSGGGVRAVDEVGNPTILATLTVIAAILPMAFVGGLMGPYMRPIPVGASAMMVSLGGGVHRHPVVRLSPVPRRRAARHEDFTDLERHEPADRLSTCAAAADRASAACARSSRRVVVLLLGAMGWSRSRQVHREDAAVRQQERVPGGGGHARGHNARGHDARVTTRPRRCVAQRAGGEPLQLYVGRLRPTTSTGSCATTSCVEDQTCRTFRSTSRRRASETGRVTMSRSPCGRRSIPSPDSSVRAAKVAEIPPGPPVLSTLVAEIYASTDEARLEAATRVKEAFEATAGVVDVDWTVEAPAARCRCTWTRADGRTRRAIPLLTSDRRMAVSGVPWGHARRSSRGA